MDKPDSPCIGVCTLSDEDRCLGCRRTLDEIDGWEELDARAQWQVVAELAGRGSGGSDS